MSIRSRASMVYLALVSSIITLGVVANSPDEVEVPMDALLTQHDDSNLNGCYDVLRGHYDVSLAVFEIDGMPSNREIGFYRILLKKQNQLGGWRILRGPLLGHPFSQIAGGFATRHILGTSDQIGTMTSNEGAFTILEASCLDDNGNPGFATANEEMFFQSAIGTGAFSGVESGHILWNGFVNGCDDPANRVASFDVVEGELCFAE